MAFFNVQRGGSPVAALQEQVDEAQANTAALSIVVQALDKVSSPAQAGRGAGCDP